MIIGLGMIMMMACKKVDNTTESTETAGEFDDLEGRIPEPTEHLLDNFKQGIDPNKWNISVRNWSTQVSNGQKAENIGYTKEGLLVLKAKGALYPSETERLTGAVLISKDKYGPGSYEIAMKVVPRLGVCNAIWTFYYENENINHEIDIELPGHKSYENVTNTNWVGETVYTSKVTETLSPANDGKWHKYRFEWSTNPKQVKYYVDDVLTNTITTDVPEYQGHLWVGVWFPNQWTGVPDFEEDYMLVDWISYEPYDSTEHPSIRGEATDKLVATRDQYPTEPSEIKARNYISNGDFEYFTPAWSLLTEDAVITKQDAFKNEQALIISNESSASQIISGQYHNFNFRLSLTAKVLVGTSGYVTIEYLDQSGEVLPDSLETIFIQSQDYQAYVREFKTINNTKAIKITLHTSKDSITLFDDLKLILK
jgi:hypothetical protein